MLSLPRPRTGNVFVAFVLSACLLGFSACGESEAVDEKSKTAAAAETKKLQIDFDQIYQDTSQSDPPTFVETAAEYGLDFKYYNDAREARYFFPEILGGGFACFDYDLDGWPDIYCTNGRGLPIDNADDQHYDQVFRNLSGKRFANATAASQTRENRFSHGCGFGDFNCDGFPDISIGNFGNITLFLNQGDGTFVRSADQNLNFTSENIDSDNLIWSVCPIVTDLDHDGLHDLFMVNYVKWNYEVPLCVYDNIRGYCGPGEFEAQRDYAFINQGDGTFREMGQEMGFTAMGKGLACAALDWDNDLRPELYIANDLVANFMYAGDQENPRHYTEVGARAGVAVCVNGLNEASMSVTPGDFDRNGWSDVFVTNYYKRKNTIYLNQRYLQFVDASFSARTHATGELFLGFGAVAVDFDKNSWPDIFVGNGHVLGPEHIPNRLTNQILRNDEGVFSDVSKTGGKFFEIPTLSRGVATIDFDQDLDTDILVNHLDRPISFLRNDSVSDNRALSLELCSPQHRPLEGSRIELTIAGQTQSLPYFAGGSYLSDSERRWTIGTGTQEQVEVRVYWNDGQVDIWSELETNCRWRFVPGKKIRS